MGSLLYVPIGSHHQHANMSVYEETLKINHRYFWAVISFLCCPFWLVSYVNFGFILLKIGSRWGGAEQRLFRFLKGLVKYYFSNNYYFQLVTNYLLTLFSVGFQPHHICYNVVILHW